MDAHCRRIELFVCVHDEKWVNSPNYESYLHVQGELTAMHLFLI